MWDPKQTPSKENTLLAQGQFSYMLQPETYTDISIYLDY